MMCPVLTLSFALVPTKVSKRHSEAICLSENPNRAGTVRSPIPRSHRAITP